MAILFINVGDYPFMHVKTGLLNAAFLFFFAGY
jgi:hypothetical protein